MMQTKSVHGMAKYFIFLLSITFNAQAGQISVQLVNANGSPVEDGVVYAESATKVPPGDIAPAAIQQKNKKFLPLVTVVQTGSSITFPNNDSVRHHVYSFSPAKAFELKLYSGVPSTPVIFDKEGTVVLGCNIHDQMLAFVHVVDTPFFGKSDAQGRVTLANLANGRYILKVWHYASVKENAILEQTITVKGAEQLTIKLDIK